ncbi:MAG: Maf family protein [Clostridia bacterium]|nr:Maf family protein [Clostridia bacterium]
MGKFYLASASKRREELLGGLIEKFTVFPAEISEKILPGLAPEMNAEKLACDKMSDVKERLFALDDTDTIIAADTMVVCDGEIFGKPGDEKDARRMLRALSGRTHEVISGLCLFRGGRTLVSHDVTRVTFFDLSDGFIDGYVKSGSPMDKAGAYGIQDGNIVKSYEGSYSNVVGLPMELLRQMLEEMSK